MAINFNFLRVDRSAGPRLTFVSFFKGHDTMRSFKHGQELDRTVLRLNDRFETMTKDFVSLKSNALTFQDQTNQQIFGLKLGLLRWKEGGQETSVLTTDNSKQDRNS